MNTKFPRFNSITDHQAWQKGDLSKAIYPTKTVDGVETPDDRYDNASYEESYTESEFKFKLK